MVLLGLTKDGAPSSFLLSAVVGQECPTHTGLDVLTNPSPASLDLLPFLPVAGPLTGELSPYARGPATASFQLLSPGLRRLVRRGLAESFSISGCVPATLRLCESSRP